MSTVPHVGDVCIGICGRGDCVGWSVAQQLYELLEPCGSFMMIFDMAEGSLWRTAGDQVKGKERR